MLIVVGFHCFLSVAITLANQWTSDDISPLISTDQDSFREADASCNRKLDRSLHDGDLASRAIEHSENMLAGKTGHNCKSCSGYGSLKDCYVDLHSENTYSSVWCWSSTVSSLRCYFHNLYYNSKYKEFVFALSPDSIVYGIDTLKDLEGLHLASVVGHNAFQIRLSTMPWRLNAESSSAKLIKGRSLVMGRFKPDNILHVFHDDLLPLYFTMRELCFDMKLCKENVNVVFADKNNKGDYWGLYQLFSRNVMELSRLYSEEGVWYRFQEAYIGLNKLSVWYQYGFGKPQGPVRHRNFLGVHLRQFASFVMESFNIKKPTAVKSGVLLSRKTNRKILNENELTSAIQGVLDSKILPFKEIKMKIMSLEESGLKNMIAKLSESAVVIGVHGSALILGMFLPPGSVMVELWPYGVNPSVATVFRTMCELKGFGVTYIPWVNRDLQSTVYHPEYPRFYGGLTHLSSNEQKEVIEGLSARKLDSIKCCDSTEWLFRIYQDTKVNIDSGSYESNSVLYLFSEGLNKAEFLSSNEKDFEDVNYHLYPGKVMSLNCKLEDMNGFTILFVEWQEPWNVRDLKCVELKYEVIVQGDNKDEFLRYEIEEPRFWKKFKVNVELVELWVTCICNSVEGSAVFIACV